LTEKLIVIHYFAFMFEESMTKKYRNVYHRETLDFNQFIMVYYYYIMVYIYIS